MLLPRAHSKICYLTKGNVNNFIWWWPDDAVNFLQLKINYRFVVIKVYKVSNEMNSAFRAHQQIDYHFL